MLFASAEKDRDESPPVGQTVVMPAGRPMRAVVTGSARRHVLAVIVHDSAKPVTLRMEEGTGPKLVLCK
jgi:hypothetical protein